MKKKKEISIGTKPDKRWRRIFSFTSVLWALVAIAFIVFMLSYQNTSRTETKIRTMTELNIQMKDSVQGKYEDKEIVLKDLRYILLTDSDKEGLISTLKSIIEYEYYEFADTVYKTTVTFTPFTVSMKLDAIYEDYDAHESLNVNEWKELSEEDFIKSAEDYIFENFEYKVREKIDIPTFIDEKIGQCYSYSELFYLLGKERGMNVRIELNEYHSWNSYKNTDGETIEFDMTIKMEVEKNEE